MMSSRNWLNGRELKTPNAGQTRSRARLVLAATSAVMMVMALLPFRASAAVTISSFTAKAVAPQIQVTWKTATEINNAGFNLLRSGSATGTFSQINTGLIPAKNPGSILGASYTYNDAAVKPGQTLYYKLVSVESGGGTQQFGPVSAAVPAAASPTATVGQPTATRTPTPLLTATITPIPSVTSTFIAVPTSASPAALVAVPSPTGKAKFARPSSNSTPEAEAAADSLESPTPGETLIAMGIKRATPEPDADSLQTETNTPVETSDSTRATYFFRLVDATLLLASGTLFLGSFLLGALSLYFFLRASLR